MGKKLAAPLLIASVFVWGIWCGGQVFNELMTVPKWSAAPPGSLKAYDALAAKGGLPFFPIFNPLFVLLSIAAAVAAWRTARRSRLWLILTAATSVVLFLSLILYLVPLVSSMFQHSIAGDMPRLTSGPAWSAGRNGNRIRIGVELLGFLFSIIA